MAELSIILGEIHFQAVHETIRGAGLGCSKPALTTHEWNGE